MLSLFDGISGGKKLFVITCNEIRRLNDYLINRPGRFHYHFRFEYPSPAEIREYLKDKIQRKYYGEIDNVIAFSKKINLNYDCLRAIAFEIENGASFRDAIGDLNIVNIESERYNVVLYFENGMTLSSGSINIDLFDQRKNRVYLYDDNGDNSAEVDFNTKQSGLQKGNHRKIKGLSALFIRIKRKYIANGGCRNAVAVAFCTQGAMQNISLFRKYLLRTG